VGLTALLVGGPAVAVIAVLLSPVLAVAFHLLAPQAPRPAS
jgi:hypothetical protein